MARRWIPRVCALVFVGGIAGIIVTTLNGNNEGVILSIGLCISFAAVALITIAATGGRRIDVFDEAAAEQLEGQVAALIAAGAPEEQVRALVRDALRVGRR